MQIGTYVNKYYPNKKGIKDHEVSIITDNSQAIIPNGVFVARCGYRTDGHDYIESAIAKGAKTIFHEKKKIVKLKGINYLLVPSSKVELARLLQYQYLNKNYNTKIIGVTGTSGKTTVTTLLYQYFKHLNYDVLLLGTSGIFSYYKMKEVTYSTTNTTPSIATIYHYLQEVGEYDYVIMEVSSQGLAEGRVLGIPFKVVVVTNLAGEHLDYHHTLGEYKLTKGKLLSMLDNINDSAIVLNKDDQSYNYFANLCLATQLSYGLKDGDIKALNIEYQMNKTSFRVSFGKNKYQLTTNLMGKFNAYNLLAVLGTLNILKESVERFLAFLKKDQVIEGRMNVTIIKQRYLVVDYAHTINAVEEVLLFLNKVKTKQLITVIGAGGERDHFKRPVFGDLATTLSDYVIFTEDNSRHENPSLIISDMLQGTKNHNYEVILNRNHAIRQALAISNPFDIIVILGKGLEDTIIRNNEIISHSDIDLVNVLKVENYD